LLAMHWSLSQLQGNIDIYPGRSPRDRFFIVVSSFASIIFLAVLVSTMIDTLFTAQDERRVWRRQRRLVDSFFDRHRIKPALRKRAEHHLRLRKNAEHSIGHEDKDRQALELFPPQLKKHLLAASRAPVLQWHPMFFHLQDFHVSLFARVCNDVVFWHANEPEDDIFMSSTCSTGAYYIAHGKFVYNAMLDLNCLLTPWVDLAFQSESFAVADSARKRVSQSLRSSVASDHDSVDSGNNPRCEEIIVAKTKTCVTRLSTGQLVSEVSLWMPWVHAGDMSAVSHGQCFSIRWSELLLVLKEYSEPYEIFCSFANRFAKSIQQLRSNGMSYKEVELLTFADVTLENN